MSIRLIFRFENDYLERVNEERCVFIINLGIIFLKILKVSLDTRAIGSILEIYGQFISNVNLWPDPSISLIIQGD